MTAGFARILTDGREEFPTVLSAAETYLASHDVPPAALAALMVALDEIVSNALDHGGAAGRIPRITVSFNVGAGQVDGEVTDDGPAFDPLTAAPPDTALSVEDRAIGGLGIHLVRSLMDEVSYRRDEGVNRLRFSKIYALG